MEWYEWIFDGVGTAIISALFSFIGYKTAIKKVSKQMQIAGDGSKQRQEVIIAKTNENNDSQNILTQTQRAGDNAEQVQYGGFSDGK